MNRFRKFIPLTLLLLQLLLPWACAFSLGSLFGKGNSDSSEQEKKSPKDKDSSLNSVNVKETSQTFPQNPPDFVISAPPQNGKYLDADVFKSLLKDLLSRLDSYSVKGSANSANNPARPSYNTPLNDRSKLMTHGGAVAGGGMREGPRHVNSLNVHHCSLHGLWLSTVAGAAIELIPEQHYGHIEIHTKIFELPDNPYPPMITSQWTGKGIISQESPTTITIVFQEHIEEPNENNGKGKERKPRLIKEKEESVDIQLPRTAVFVGQCLVCFGNAMLQGTWVVFPSTQTCTAGGGSQIFNNGKSRQGLPPFDGQPRSDSIYLLQYY